MSNYPLMEVGDREGNSPSPFANLKDDSSSPERKPIWRTGSLDEGWRRVPPEENTDENEDHDSSAVTALHSSFDASLLDGEEQGNSIFRPTSAGKHARNAEEQDVVAPGTVRKLRRRSNLPPGGTKSTPGRHSHNLRSSNTKGDRTPNSAATRRRSQLRRSPRHHQSSARVPPTAATTTTTTAATPGTFKFLQDQTTSPATPRVALFGSTTTTTQLKPPPQILSPTRAAATPGLPQPTAVKSTSTTANSSFDGLNDSHETSSPTPFRFTSFPASLPRVNNARGADRNFMCPPSTRKHMTFSAFAAGDNGQLDGQDNGGKGSIPMHLSTDHSQEEDGAHNSSLSSLSAEAQHQREVAAPSTVVQPKALDWKSPQDADIVGYRKNSVDSETSEAQLGATSSVHARLFADDELAHSPSQDSRMKLVFEPLATSPAKDERGVRYVWKDKETELDLSRPYEQRKTQSFPSTTASSTTPLRNISTFEDGTIDSGMTPSRQAGGALNMADHPLSPEHQVKFHFHVDATQCSPIPGIPEEEDDDGVTRNVTSATAMDMDGPAFEPSSSLRSGNDRPPRSASRKKTQRRSGSLSSTRKDSSAKLSPSIETADGASSTTSSKQRALRPMPDMNAFDAGLSTRSASSSRNDKSSDDSSGPMVIRAAPPSPQLVCPPTPQRTPAWACSETGPQQKFSRQNSLIATKVLATCPSQVLDGHSSLENSLLEDDDDDESLEAGLFARKHSLAFSTVAEDLEQEGKESSPARDVSTLNEMFTTQSSGERQYYSTAPPVSSFDPVHARPMASTSCANRVSDVTSFRQQSGAQNTAAHARQSSGSAGSFGDVGSVISFTADFENLGKLGSGAFADVYKVRSKEDNQLYAVKRNRRHFRGKRDRDMAMAEVRIMQRLQSVCAQRGASSSDKKDKAKTSYSLYLLFFLRAWQEEGHFFCQTELCCRDTCRELKVSLGPQWAASKTKYPSLLRHFPTGMSTFDSDGQLIPDSTVWKICHDVAAGLSHIHSHGVVHNDIKPSNIFLVGHNRLGALLKIGDFGIAGDVGTSEDGQEGDTSYMAPELLSPGTRHPSADMFSLGLTLYELASNLFWELPSEGPQWQELRHGSHSPDLPFSRSPELSQLIQVLLNPNPSLRPRADDILDRVPKAKEAGSRCDDFLRDYIRDIEEFDRVAEERRLLEQLEADERGQTPRNANGRTVVRDMFAASPPPTVNAPFAPSLFTPEPAAST